MMHVENALDPPGDCLEVVVSEAVEEGGFWSTRSHSICTGRGVDMGPAHHRSRIELFAHVGPAREFGQSPPDLWHPPSAGCRGPAPQGDLGHRTLAPARGRSPGTARPGVHRMPVIGARRIRDPGAGQAMVGCATKCRGMCLLCRHQALPEFEAVRAAVEEADLAALLARVFPRLGELEAPILEAASLSMWEYAIMTELASADAISQSELSQRVRRDPTPSRPAPRRPAGTRPGLPHAGRRQAAAHGVPDCGRRRRVPAGQARDPPRGVCAPGAGLHAGRGRQPAQPVGAPDRGLQRATASPPERA